ncbi:MAG: polyphosphate kinase, partial [Planctomycetota bacterium]
MASAQELIRSLHQEEGVSEKEIAKRLGLSLQAVRDVLEQPPARRPHQLDPFRDQILNLLRSDRGATVKRVGALVGPKGPELNERDVRKYVAELKKTVATAPETAEPDAARTPPHPDPVPAPGPDGAHDYQSPDYYLNRELTWLNFNFRVLHEAEDERTPLLDRIKFISIVGSNLDEFFMKRIGGLKQQVGAGLHDLTVDGRTPQRQIDECHEVVRQLETRKREVLPKVLRALEEEGIVLRSYENLGAEDRDYLRQYYFDNIYPLVTPQSTDPAHPFPFISNLSLNLLVALRHAKDDEPLLARVKVPIGAGIPRLLKLPNRLTFVPMESVMASNLDLLFPGMVIDSCDYFRVTRNANTELDEGKADDLLAMIETEMRERKFAPIVRLEVTTGVEPHHRGMIAA